MSYASCSIQQIVRDIESTKMFLPAIQRKFVWPKEKIELLFDSLMKNYPIGSFLFWELKSEKAKEYVFYNFLKKFDEKNPNNEVKKGSYAYPEITGVLDGQQRLSSLFIGLQGTYTEKIKYKRSSTLGAYRTTSLFLNLLTLPTENITEELENEKDYEFSFLTQNEASQNKRKTEKGSDELIYWFEIGKIMYWPNDPDIDDIFEEMEQTASKEIAEKLNLNKRQIKKELRILHSRVCKEPLINYFKIEKDDLDDILKIFVRVNSGGTVLSKTDLLFSTIIATWEKGRDEIEEFLKEINSKNFGFNNDFLMRTCLVLSDLPVLFKVNSFKSENVELIKNNWSDIKNALFKTIELLIEFGISEPVLSSQNAVIVIAYHFFKGGDSSPNSKNGLKKYLFNSLLKNAYGGQGDQVIATFRNILRTKNEDKSYSLMSKTFPIHEILEAKLPAHKSIKIELKDIESFLSNKKGSSAFYILAILYPNLKYNEVSFHMDHIHPESGFTVAKLNGLSISEEKKKDWLEKKDMIPNLQFMERIQNITKSAIPFKEWFYGINEHGEFNVKYPEKFCSDNFIPANVSLEFKDFDSFFLKRKELISIELMLKFGLPIVAT